MIAQEIKITLIEPNNGQIEGLPKNPRQINREDYRKLKKSIEEDPEMLALRELLVYPHNGKYIIIGGNMRYKVLQDLGYTTCLCKVIDQDTPIEKLKAYLIKDNGAFGSWDFDLLANEWDSEELTEWGVPLYGFEEDEDKDKDKDKGERDNKDDESDNIAEDEEDDDIEDDDDFSVYVNDELYPSDNEYEIPTLLKNMQGGRLELPLSPWGAESRKRTDVTTYHFYVDDYRFEALWKDPSPLICSGCKAIVEPNCSIHDQTPIAVGLQQIYKKRWLARYMQELGIKVYVDLNVSHKFAKYNTLGVPKGYNAFFTRGLADCMNALRVDLQMAKEISGVDNPNLIVYGGGQEVKQFCQDNNLLYVTDYINVKIKK